LTSEDCERTNAKWLIYNVTGSDCG